MRYIYEEKLLKILKKRSLTLSTAESCSGGELANRITNIPGSSRVFILGVVAYSDDSKNKILKIPFYIIRKKGAVSEETSRLMAKNVLKLSGSNLAVGITGIAGPTGGTKFKPIGTVFITVTDKNKTLTKEFHFKGSRIKIKKQSAHEALNMLFNLIK